MKKYIVEWQATILADTPEDAAREALEMIQGNSSEPMFFDIRDMDRNSVRIYPADTEDQS